jgi:hypothetical protein
MFLADDTIVASVRFTAHKPLKTELIEECTNLMGGTAFP